MDKAQVEVPVTFDAIGNAIGVGTISPIPVGTTAIVFNLTTLNSDVDAVFDSTPIEWTGTAPPEGTFEAPMLELDGLRFVLVDNNANSTLEPETFTFFIRISHQGELFQHDPAIINEPPGPQNPDEG